MPNMTLFKIIVNIAFAVLLAGKTIKSAAAEVVTSVANAVPSGTSSDCKFLLYNYLRFPTVSGYRTG